MDDLDVLVRDFGYRPHGKSAPMRSSDAPPPRSASADHRGGAMFEDVFGGGNKYNSKSSVNDFDYDSIFKSNNNENNKNNSNGNLNTSSRSSGKVMEEGPVYDEDIFEGLGGVKSKSVSDSRGMGFEEDVFGGIELPRKQKRSGGDDFDDLLGGLGRNEREEKSGRSSSMGGMGMGMAMEDFLGSLGRNEKGVAENKNTGRSSSHGDFDDLLGGFGAGSSAAGNRSTNISRHSFKQTSPLDDPFVGLGSTSPVSSSSGASIDPLKDMHKLGKSGNTKSDTSSMSRGGFDDLDPLNGFNKSAKNGGEKDGSPSRSRPGSSGKQTTVDRKHRDTSPLGYSEGHSQKKVPVDSSQESPVFGIPSVTTDPKKSFGQNVSPPPLYSDAPYNDIWISVTQVPLFTEPTKAPPPSRPPPPVPRRTSKAESGYFSSNSRKKSEDYSPSYSSYSDSPKPRYPEGNKSSASQIDDLENFAMGRSQNSIHSDANIHPGDDMDAAADAMKEAMDRAEAKFRHAKEVREREHAKAAKSKENFQAEKDEQTTQAAREREYRENQERLELERRQKEREEEEREQRRLEKERTERERARQAVERATREARERAGAEAREKASAEARLRAERAAVGKAQAEARDRASKAAVQRVQAEARGRAAAEAKERADKAASEAREKSTAEAREREAKEKAEAQRRSQRAAVERVAAEARERAAVDARERAANAARASQQKSEDDLESFFSSRPSSVPKARTSSSDPFFDQFQNEGGFSAAKRTPSTSGPASNLKKASSATNIVDDLSSIFGAPSSSGNFQDVEGETEDRRRARLERHQRTQERAAKALAEKNQRDMNVQREQEERHRIGETLDFEIKRWAAGKEGNLRALLSTLQYVLWPECGWQPVSLTDLITGASVKKYYRKSTLCIHPDKVQQKGASLQQKYIAEKVFDLLKEAWNKFNSEELF